MIKFITTYKNLLLGFLLMIVVGTFIMLFNTISKLKQEVSVTTTNNKAMFVENNDLKNKAIQYQLNIDLLDYFNDSINIKLDSVINDNKIKQKKITALLYIKTTTSKKDTVRTKDTIFNTNVHIDTTLCNTGYSLQLKLNYPNEIIINPSFINELYVIFYNKKETIKPPSKYFFIRWFLKKHTIVEVVVINSNPYMDIKERRFINILKN